MGDYAADGPSQVVTHYEVDAKQAVRDVQSYLSELQEVGLVRTV